MFYRSIKNALIGALVLCVLSVFSTAAMATGFSLGDAANFAVLYEGTGGHNLGFNNSNLTGNIGIGGTGKFAGNGPGTITGTVEFSAANTGQFSNSGLTITGNGGVPLYSQGNIATDLTNLNSLSSTLGGESGTAVTIGNGGSVNANTSGTLDGSGNKVFTATMNSFDNGNTFTITGDGTHNVVFNIASTGGHGFNGEIILAGGITSDQVLFNLSGGNTLTISTNGGITTGTFLDPNGNIQINHSVLDGRLFGGDSQDLQIVSGATINAPADAPAVPEPCTLLLLGSGLAGLVALRKKFRI